MWHQQPPSWGWPPNVNYQYDQQQADPSQQWAAAAALWAQQRQIQGQNGVATPPTEKPPEPPGPPPQMPPLPPMKENGGNNNMSVEVHDYMHGQAPQPVPEVVDYQHGKAQSLTTEPISQSVTDVIDYNHGKLDGQENPTPQWDYNNAATWPQQYPSSNNFFPDQWTQQNWSEQWPKEQTMHYAGAPYDQEYQKNSGYESNEHNGNHKQHPSGFRRIEEAHGSGNSSPDPLEVAKKSKSLPLWLRQGLEKMEKEKKKEDHIGGKLDLPSSKNISGYQHGSPMSSPERNNESGADVNADIDGKPLRSRKRSPTPDSSPQQILRRSESIEEEEEEVDEEEKQRNLILKIKTWMTEILLGVTNTGLQEVCKEVYFEMKRSAKSKATQLRRSGGLDALRTSLGGGDDEPSSSEEEAEEEHKVNNTSRTRVGSEKMMQSFRGNVYAEENRLKRPVTIDNSPKKTFKERSVEHNEHVTLQKRKSHSPVNQQISRELINEPKNTDVQGKLLERLRKAEAVRNKTETLKILAEKRARKESETDSSNESEESSESDRGRRHKKSKKSRKKSKRYDRTSSSSDSEYRKKKKKRRERSSSDDSEYLYRKKKSKGKKRKHKDRSRSPPRHKKRR